MKIFIYSRNPYQKCNFILQNIYQVKKKLKKLFIIGFFDNYEGDIKKLVSEFRIDPEIAGYKKKIDKNVGSADEEEEFFNKTEELIENSDNIYKKTRSAGRKDNNERISLNVQDIDPNVKSYRNYDYYKIYEKINWNIILYV